MIHIDLSFILSLEFCCFTVKSSIRERKGYNDDIVKNGRIALEERRNWDGKG